MCSFIKRWNKKSNQAIEGTKKKMDQEQYGKKTIEFFTSGNDLDLSLSMTIWQYGNINPKIYSPCS